MSKRGLLIVLSGPSGSGKGTVRGALMALDDNLRYSISATTRAPRVGERDGVDYYFLSVPEFERRIAAGEFLEYTNYLGNYYGTLLQAVDTVRDKGGDVLLEIETKGAQDVMKKAPDCLSIFILPPSVEELRRRLTGRGTEQNAELEKRLANARAEIEDSRHYEYTVVNDDVDITAREILVIIEQARRNNERK